MKPAGLLLFLLACSACAGLPEPGTPGAPADARYCGEPERDARGRIKRSQAVKEQFARSFPCPSTGRPEASCPGWHLDHVVPLVAGGCDLQFNLQWLPSALKTCRFVCKDRWERDVYNSARPGRGT